MLLLLLQGGEVAKEFGIPKDLFVLPGRETYVLDKNGEVTFKFNSQFQPEQHVEKALDELESSAVSLSLPF